MANKYWLGFTSSKFDPQLDRYTEPELSLARKIKRTVHGKLMEKDEDGQAPDNPLGVLYSIHSCRNMHLVYNSENEHGPIRDEIYLHISPSDKMLFALLPACWTKVSICLEPDCYNDGFKGCPEFLCEYHMKELKSPKSFANVHNFSRLCLVLSRSRFGNSESLENWDLYLEDKSDWIPQSLKIKQKLEQGIASVIERFSKRYMNNLELDNMHDNLYRRICGALKRSPHVHDEVLILSYCPEKERILYKFVGDEDWGMICNYTIYKCLKPCVKGETLCKLHAILGNPVERVNNSAKLGCKSDNLSSSVKGKLNDSYNLEIKIIPNSSKSKSFKIEFIITL